MAIFTQIIAIDMITIFTGCSGAIVAGTTITVNGIMIKIHLLPIIRHMAIITGFS
jgi:hypothetical protein